MTERFDAFVTGITVCYKYIQRIKAAEMGELGLKGAHVMCLYYLRKNPGGLTAAQLSALCAEDKAAISRTVAELRMKRYVTSASGKNYRAQLYLTPSGQEISRQMEPLIANWVGIGGEGLTDSARSEFYRSLSLISENLRNKIDSEEKY